MPILTTDQLHEERLLNTTQERQVLALEMIADQLAKIGHELEGIRTTGSKVSDNGVELSVDTIDSDEAVGPEMDKAVTRNTIAVFSVGPYRYTKLADAMAQVARTASASRGDIEHLMNRRIG